MAIDSTPGNSRAWRTELPVLAGGSLTLREPSPHDLGTLVDLLSIADAPCFGIKDPITELSVRRFIDSASRNRGAGLAFTYAITMTASRALVGLVQVRQLDPTFEAAEWEFIVIPSSRGTGIFLEAARLVGSFTFTSIGTHRLEARVLLQNGRGNGALRKLGAVQEGILRRSIRRGGEYLDQVLWSVLNEDWGDHWVSTAPRVH
jgi:RimJ/RimL family protein N-acetyltransferase